MRPVLKQEERRTIPCTYIKYCMHSVRATILLHETKQNKAKRTDRVSFLQQQLRQIRTVLACDASDQRHLASLFFRHGDKNMREVSKVRVPVVLIQGRRKFGVFGYLIFCSCHWFRQEQIFHASTRSLVGIGGCKGLSAQCRRMLDLRFYHGAILGVSLTSMDYSTYAVFPNFCRMPVPSICMTRTGTAILRRFLTCQVYSVSFIR